MVSLDIVFLPISLTIPLQNRRLRTRTLTFVPIDRWKVLPPLAVAWRRLRTRLMLT